MRRRTLCSGIAGALPAVLVGCSDLTGDDSAGDDSADPSPESSLDFEEWIPYTPGDQVTRVYYYDFAALLAVDIAANWIFEDPDAEVYGIGLDELDSSIFIEGSGWSAEIIRGQFDQDEIADAYANDHDDIDDTELTESDAYGDYRVFVADELAVGVNYGSIIETTDGRDRLEAILDARTGSGPRLVDEDDDFERFVDETSSYRDFGNVNRNLNTVEGFDIDDAETTFVEVAAFTDEESVESYEEVRQPRELTDWGRYDATYDHDVDGRFLTVEGSVETDTYFDR